MSDFLTFRRMLAPLVIQTIFWLAFVASAVSGAGAIIVGARDRRASEVLIGLGVLFLGPLVARLYCEVLMVIFRINDSLTDIRKLGVWAAERAYALEADEDEEDDVVRPEQVLPDS
jgi:hypothetical protein